MPRIVLAHGYSPFSHEALASLQCKQKSRHNPHKLGFCPGT
jgi:hypothetical protein